MITFRYFLPIVQVVLLCKLLPLWSGISCNIFDSPTVTSSSANVESYFKDAKHVLKEIIPAVADIFLQHHMDSINDSIITASQKYAKIIDLNIAGRTKESNDLAKSTTQMLVTHEDDPILELLDRLSFEEVEKNKNDLSNEKNDETPEKTIETDDDINAKQSKSSECIARLQVTFQPVLTLAKGVRKMYTVCLDVPLRLIMKKKDMVLKECALRVSWKIEKLYNRVTKMK